MHTILLYSHIILMCSSLFMTGTFAIIAVLNRYISPQALKANVFVTIGGIGSGIILLISYPLAIRCIILTAYVGAFVFVHRFVRSQQKSYLNERKIASFTTQR